MLCIGGDEELAAIAAAIAQAGFPLALSPNLKGVEAGARASRVVVYAPPPPVNIASVMAAIRELSGFFAVVYVGQQLPPGAIFSNLKAAVKPNGRTVDRVLAAVRIWGTIPDSCGQRV